MGSNQTTVAVLKGGTHLDYRKLLVDVDGNLYVRGTTTQGGLSKAIKTQKMTVNDVAQLIPATALEAYTSNIMRFSYLFTITSRLITTSWESR